MTEIEIASPTKAVMKFNSPAPTAPQWLAFLGSYVVPKEYMEKVGVDAFRKKPVGTGPYKLVEYELNSRIVLERNDEYWGPKPQIARVTFEIIKDPSARVAAIQSGQVDITVERAGPRGASGLQREPALAGEINPITRVMLLQVRNDLAFADQNVRLAAHHAIDKEALSKAFYGGAAVPLSVVGDAGHAGLSRPTIKFKYDPEPGEGSCWRSPAIRPGEAGARSGSPSTNGQFPERLRHRARDRADVEAGRHRRQARDDRIREIFRAQSRQQAAGGNAL